MEYETEDYKVRDFDGVTVVRLKNPNLTGLLEVNRIGEELKTMLDGGVRKLVIDFKHVKHCGSSALGVLIAIQKKMGRANGLMVEREEARAPKPRAHRRRHQSSERPAQRAGTSNRTCPARCAPPSGARRPGLAT